MESLQNMFFVFPLPSLPFLCFGVFENLDSLCSNLQKGLTDQICKNFPESLWLVFSLFSPGPMSVIVFAFFKSLPWSLCKTFSLYFLCLLCLFFALKFLKIWTAFAVNCKRSYRQNLQELLWNLQVCWIKTYFSDLPLLFLCIFFALETCSPSKLGQPLQ